jgi:uncharacterized YccA/Bax inhibitor family protein
VSSWLEQAKKKIKTSLMENGHILEAEVEQIIGDVDLLLLGVFINLIQFTVMKNGNIKFQPNCKRDIAITMMEGLMLMIL